VRTSRTVTSTLSKKWGVAVKLVPVLLLWWLLAAAQDLPDGPKPQNNAPSPPPASQPATPAKTAPPPPSPLSLPPQEQIEDETDQPQPEVVKNIPVTPQPANQGSSEQLFTLSKQVNFVLVPVTVKTTSGNLVAGLLKNDFTIYEGGSKQQIRFFTSDPFPLSAAVVIDLGLPDVTLRKVEETYSALVGAFGQFDELEIFAYGTTVRKVQDFTGITNARLSSSFTKLKQSEGTNGPAVVGGPLGSSGPTVNGHPLDPGAPQVQTAPKESRVLNDAVLAAAQELGKRDPTRRKIIFIISDGREVGSTASYEDVKRVLLTRQIAVYAVGVGGAAIPGYKQLERLRVPGLGYGDILPKYASATGGQVFSEISESSIETAYSRVTSEARNQYTIGYTTRSTPSSSYRSIEVRVHRPDLKIYTRDGYYPLPPGR
jgi:VWFA-related protein